MFKMIKNQEVSLDLEITLDPEETGGLVTPILNGLVYYIICKDDVKMCTG